MSEKEAFQIVLNKIRTVPIYNGKYDAKHGDMKFMSGVASVMDWIAYEAEDEDFEDEFWGNIAESQLKAVREEK